MKKIFTLCTLFLSLLIILTACSNEKTKVFTTKYGNNQENETTLTYKGEVVNRLKTISNITDLGTDEEAAYNSIKASVNEENKDIDGLSFTIDKKDGKVVITWDLDFTKINFEKDKDRLHFKKSSLDEERKLNYIEEELKKNGAVEKK
jgi:putative lipoprotein